MLQNPTHLSPTQKDKQVEMGICVFSQEQNTKNTETRSHRLPCTCLAMQRGQKDKKVEGNHQIRENIQGRVYCLVK